MENKTIINLKGQEYFGKLDFTTLGNIQRELNNQGIKIGFQEIFAEIAGQNFAVINEVVIQAILRCHPQIKRYMIEEKMDLQEMENIFEFLSEVVKVALPQSDKGK